MAEISNKTLALLLIAAIIISLGGMFITLNRLKQIFVPGVAVTGLATDEGTLTLTIAENVLVNFTIDTMDWGTGAIDSGKSKCLLQSNFTNGSATGPWGVAGNNCTVDTFYGNVSGFVVENQGNRNVSLNITGGTATTLFGAEGGGYRFNITNKPNNVACQNASGESGWSTSAQVGDDYNEQISWTSFAGTTEITLCCCNETMYGMPYIDGNDTFYIHIQLEVPIDAQGALSDTITLEATSWTATP